MIDIWKEKPTRKIGIDASDFRYKYYSGVEMDAWIERVKAHCDYYENLAAEFAELYADAQENAEKYQTSNQKVIK